MATASAPRGVWVTAAFFAVSGLLEIVLDLRELPFPWPFWPAWEALGRSLLHFLLAFGLWRRIAVCRSIAMVYCIAVVITYLVVLGMAYARAPVSFPSSLIVHSLYQVPSCLLLFPFLRSPEASLLFPRPLFHR